MFLTRAADVLGVPAPDPSNNRQGPVPETLASGWNQSAIIRAWDLGLLPSSADFTQGITRAQGEAMVSALAAMAH